MKEAGIPIDPELVYFDSIKVKSGYEGIQKFLKQNKKLKGVVCASDDIAMGAINSLRDNGLKIPEDVSVIGFNDNFAASIFYPKITTVSQPTYDMGSVAMRMLIKLLNKKELEEPHYVLEHQLIERESTI
jgi:LacI family transcriptional regulator